MKSNRLVALALASATLVGASAPAMAQDIGGLVAGLALSALTGNRGGGYGYGQQGYNPYGGNPYQAYGTRPIGYGQGYGQGYGAGYGAQACRIVRRPVTDMFGNVVDVRLRRICG